MQEDPVNETPINEMTPEEAKAALGFATNLSENILMPESMGPSMEESQDIETAEGDAGVPEAPQTPQEPQYDAEGFKAEIREMVSQEIGSLKEEIKKALSDEESEA